MNPNPFYKKSRLIYLISGYLQDDLDIEEHNGLRQWREEKPENEALFQLLISEQYQQQELTSMSLEDTDRAYQKIKARLRTHINYKLWIAIAAALLLGVFVLIKYYTPETSRNNQTVKMINDVAPGSNRAVIQLSNGKRIMLSEAQAGIKIDKNDIRYTDGSRISPISGNKGATVTTPRGGQYQVVLPDGSKVWLNAESSLSYDDVLAEGKGNRLIELSGEAYFEVTKDQRRPFIVQTKNERITVLGTHFNVNAYNDESSSVTTLIEGVVRVATSQGKTSNKSVLKPGQEALVNPSGKISTQKGDMESAIAWKNGKIIYKEADVPSVLRKVARWYDISIRYEGKVPTDLINGTISRQSKLSTLLKMFAMIGIHYRLEEKDNIKTLIIENP